MITFELIFVQGLWVRETKACFLCPLPPLTCCLMKEVRWLWGHFGRMTLRVHPMASATWPKTSSSVGCVGLILASRLCSTEQSVYPDQPHAVLITMRLQHDLVQKSVRPLTVFFSQWFQLWDGLCLVLCILEEPYWSLQKKLACIWIGIVSNPANQFGGTWTQRLWLEGVSGCFPWACSIGSMRCVLLCCSGRSETLRHLPSAFCLHTPPLLAFCIISKAYIYLHLAGRGREVADQVIMSEEQASTLPITQMAIWE